MAYWSRNYAAQRITELRFEVAPRTMIGWKDVPLVYLNGRAHAKEEDWLRAADRRLAQMLSHQGISDVKVLQSAVRANEGRRKQEMEKLFGYPDADAARANEGRRGVEKPRARQRKRPGKAGEVRAT
jgi:hypothetical protein